MKTTVYSLSYSTNNHGADDEFYFGQGVIVSLCEDEIEKQKDEFTAEMESHLDGAEPGFEYEVISEEVNILDPEDLAFSDFPEMARDQARLLLDAEFGELYVPDVGANFRSQKDVEEIEKDFIAQALGHRSFDSVTPAVREGILAFDFDGVSLSRESCGDVESVKYGRFDSDGDVVEESAFYLLRKTKGRFANELSKIADYAFDICAAQNIADITETAATVTAFVSYLNGDDQEGPTMGAMARLPDSAREYLFRVLWGAPVDPIA